MINQAKAAYEWAIERGIAKEVARAVLPEGLTMSRMYVNGTIRSWLHYIDIRSDIATAEILKYASNKTHPALFSKMVNDFAEMFAKDNPRFDVKRFHEEFPPSR